MKMGFMNGIARRFFTIVVLAMFLEPDAAPQAADRLVPLGVLVGQFDIYRNATTPSKRTFPDDVGRCLGGTALENGDVAMMFRTDISPPDHIATIYTLRLNRADYGAFQIIGQGLSLTYDANPNLLFIAGPTLYGADKYALIGYWQEVVGERVNHHYYLMSCPRTDGRASMICELSKPASDLCFVPGEGRQEDYFLLNAGATDFYRVNRLGVLLGVVPADGFHINTSPENYCRVGSSLTMTTNQDFLAIRSDDRYNVTDCSSWMNYSCIRFNQNGDFKGAWDFGRTIARADRVPEDIGPIIALPNGDMISSHFYAYQDVRDNDRNGRTYRYYITRPPDELNQPRCQVTPQVLMLPGSQTGVTNRGIVRVSNVGSSALTVSDIAIEGANASLFQVEGARSFQLTPSYGQQDVPGTYRDVAILGCATKQGVFTAKLSVASSDPSNPTVKTDVSLTSFSDSYRDIPLLDASSGITNIQSVILSSGSREAFFIASSRGTNGTFNILKTPYQRDGSNQIASFDAQSAIVVAENIPSTVKWVEQGPSNQLWYGPVKTSANPSVPAIPKWGIVQRKPDGTEYVQELKFWETTPCVDAEWTPDQSVLLVALESLRAPLRCLIAPRADGFHDITIKGSLNNCAIPDPNPLTSLSVLTGSKQQLLLAYSTNSGMATLFRGWTTNFWLGTETPSPSAGILVSANMGIRGICFDALTGDCLYAAVDGSIHRLDGIRNGAFWPNSIPFKIKRVSRDAFYGAVWLILEWENLGLPVAVESSTNLLQWKTATPASTSNQRYMEITTGPAFYRLRLEDGR